VWRSWIEGVGIEVRDNDGEEGGRKPPLMTGPWSLKRRVWLEKMA